MKKILMPALALFVVLNSFAQDKPVLVETAWLNDHLKDPTLVLLHVSTLEMDYTKEHIAGAGFLWTGSLAPNTPQGSYNAPTVKEAEAALQRLGVSNDSHVVLYHALNELTPTARMFVTLEHFGLRGKVSYLNGGLDAWKRAGFPVTTEVPVVKKGKFIAKAGNLLVDKEYVLKTLKGTGAVVDARVKEIYDGAPSGFPRDGHIAGAQNIPYNEMYDQKSYVFKSNEQLTSYFNPVIPEKNKEVITYCFIGQTASAVYLAGRILGYDMKVYDGSMQEWSRIESLPMEKSKP